MIDFSFSLIPIVIPSDKCKRLIIIQLNGSKWAFIILKCWPLKSHLDIEYRFRFRYGYVKYGHLSITFWSRCSFKCVKYSHRIYWSVHRWWFFRQNFHEFSTFFKKKLPKRWSKSVVQFCRLLSGFSLTFILFTSSMNNLLLLGIDWRELVYLEDFSNLSNLLRYLTSTIWEYNVHTNNIFPNV